MNRVEIINHLIDKFEFKSYLEIGTRNSVTYNAVKAAKKTGVDPNTKVFDRSIYVKTSDEFFKINKDKFDIVFIDGMHEHEQVKRDIENSLKCLNKGGIILLHDCNPVTEQAQLVPKQGTGTWNGDVWKAVVDYRKNGTRGIAVVDTDHGIGVISSKIKGAKLKTEAKLTYQNLEKYRVKWLNLITIEEFKELF